MVIIGSLVTALITGADETSVWIDILAVSVLSILSCITGIVSSAKETKLNRKQNRNRMDFISAKIKNPDQ